MQDENNWKTIAEEWDAIANERFNQLNNSEDQSYEKILKPNLIKRLLASNLVNVLDVGCGVGTFTKEVAKFSINVTGIDISSKSILLAKNFNCLPNVIYSNINISDIAVEKKFTSIYSNMAFMTMPEIDMAVDKIFEISSKNCRVLLTIAHPAFWPLYWNYYSENSFSYLKQSEIVTEFKTRNKNYTGFITRHYHRPIEFYVNKFLLKGFNLLELSELEEEEPQKWYPRFLLLNFIKR